MSSLDELPGRPLPMRSTERCGLCAAICAALVARTSALFNKSAREGNLHARLGGPASSTEDVSVFCTA